MDVDCEGCAGCCVDWRALSPERAAADRRDARYEPVDDAANQIALTREDLEALLDAGLGDVATPRLFHAPEDASGAAVGDHRLAAIDGRVAFSLALRKLPKPVVPFGTEPTWLPTCAFLDPASLQCRIHGDAAYPAACAAYPGHELALGEATECERVEAAFGDERLVDDDPPPNPTLLLNAGAVGGTVFVYPGDDGTGAGSPDGTSPPESVPPVTGALVERAAAGELTRADRARFVAAAVAGAPGTTDVDPERFAAVRDRVLATDSWVDRAAAEWATLAAEDRSAEPGLAERVEEERGAPPTPGWGDDVDD